MKVIFWFLMVVFFQLNSFAQKDSIKMDLISEYLDLNKYNNEYTFYIDTVLELDMYSIYGITPFVSSYSFCIFFKRDSIINCEGFPNDMSKMPYSFRSLQTHDNKKFVLVYWYGDGTTSATIDFFLLEFKEEGIVLSYADFVYHENKILGTTTVNSYFVDLNSGGVIIKKYCNDHSEFNILKEQFEIPIIYESTNQNIEIEEYIIYQ